MFKIIGVTLIIIFCSFIGFEQSFKLSNRVLFLEDFISFISYMKTQIRCTSDYITNIICFYSPPQKLSFLKEIGSEKLLNSDFSDIWKQALTHIPKTYGLKKNDYNTLEKFGAGLGLSDTEGQISHCEFYITMTENRLSEALLEKKKKCRLYQILGICAGICIALVFV